MSAKAKVKQGDPGGELPPRTAYMADPYTWAREQAVFLRRGQLDAVDAVLVAEELDEVASAEYDKLESALTVLLQHMLKWDYQPALRSRSWEGSIREHRRRALRQLKKNPGLKSRLAEALSEAYEDGRDRASAETGLSIDFLPAKNPYDWTAISERVFDLDQEGRGI
jgi:hypothetical protein